MRWSCAAIRANYTLAEVSIGALNMIITQLYFGDSSL